MANLPDDVRKSSTVAIPRVSVYRFASDNPDLTISDAVVLSFVFFCIREGHGVCYASDEGFTAQFGKSLTARTVERCVSRLVTKGYLIREVDQKRPDWCKRILHPGPKVDWVAPSYSREKAVKWLCDSLASPDLPAKTEPGFVSFRKKAKGFPRKGDGSLRETRKAQTGLSASEPEVKPEVGQTYSKRPECKPVHPTGGKPAKKPSSSATSGQEAVFGQAGQPDLGETVKSGQVQKVAALVAGSAQGEPELPGVGKETPEVSKPVSGQNEGLVGRNPSADLAFAFAGQVEQLTGSPQLKPGGKEFAAAKRLLAVGTKEAILAMHKRVYLAAVAGGDKTRFWVITDIADLAGKWARLAGFIASGEGFRIGGHVESGPGLKERVVANGKPSTQSRAILAPAWRESVSGF